MQMDPPKTISYEWLELIGDSYQFIAIHPWIPLVPIIFILSQFILNGLKRVLIHIKRKKLKINFFVKML
jgi:peptide/nickel transport system permease protein